MPIEVGLFLGRERHIIVFRPFAFFKNEAFIWYVFTFPNDNRIIF